MKYLVRYVSKYLTTHTFKHLAQCQALSYRVFLVSHLALQVLQNLQPCLKAMKARRSGDRRRMWW